MRLTLHPTAPSLTCRTFQNCSNVSLLSSWQSSLTVNNFYHPRSRASAVVTRPRLRLRLSCQNCSTPSTGTTLRSWPCWIYLPRLTRWIMKSSWSGSACRSASTAGHYPGSGHIYWVGVNTSDVAASALLPVLSLRCSARIGPRADSLYHLQCWPSWRRRWPRAVIASVCRRQSDLWFLLGIQHVHVGVWLIALCRSCRRLDALQSTPAQRQQNWSHVVHFRPSTVETPNRPAASRRLIRCSCFRRSWPRNLHWFRPRRGHASSSDCVALLRRPTPASIFTSVCLHWLFPVVGCVTRSLASRLR
jgi:hypothetical protein